MIVAGANGLELAIGPGIAAVIGVVTLVVTARTNRQVSAARRAEDAELDHDRQQTHAEKQVDQAIEAMSGRLDMQDRIIAELRSEVADCHGDRDGLASLVSKQERRINSQQQRIGALEAQVRAMGGTP